MTRYPVDVSREQMLERPLPHSADAERAILGSIVLDNGLVNQAIELLRPEDFYTRAHQFIFRAMIGLSERGAEINPILLGEELRREGTLEQTGGLAYVSELTYGLPHFTNLAHYAKIVHDKSLLRQLVKVSNKITSEALEEEDEASLILDHAEQMIFALADERTRQGFAHIKPVAEGVLEKVQEMSGRPALVTGLTTGFRDLDELTSGFQPSDLIIVAARPSMGKAQPLTARVKTPTGWARMGDLRVGDPLASADGAPSFVTGVFPQGEREVFRVTFSDGRSTLCCAEHLWRIHNRKWGAAGRVIQTKDVAALLAEPQYRNRLSVPVPSGDFGVELLSPPLDPWVLGALIGDGRLDGRISFSSGDAELVSRLERGLTGGYQLVRESAFDYRIRRVGARPPARDVTPHPHAVKAALRSLGLFGLKSHEKFIPPAYLNASKEQRLELLRGLMDTDGTVESSKTLRFCTVSRRLALDVQTLARSLGALASVSERRPVYTHLGERREGRVAYVVTIRHARPEQFVWLGRKRERLRGRAARTPRLNVVAVEKVGAEETRCIAVSHPSRLYITDDYVVTHNTAFCLNIAQNAAIEAGAVVGIFSLEMSKDSLVMRMLCSEARIDAHRFRGGRLARDEWARLAGALGTLSDCKIFIDDTPGISVLEMRAKARRLAAEQKRLDLVIVDYLQLMSGSSRRTESRQQEVSQISRELKGLAKELNVPLVALSQLSRAAETRTDHRPQLSDLRECVTGDTLVLLADGSRVPIARLVGMEPEVFALSPEGHVVSALSDKVWKVGRRPVFDVQLASGRRIRATAKHRLRVWDGWRRVAELRLGERLAVARHLPEPRDVLKWSDERVALLGHLIGDGSYLKGQPMRYTTGSEENSSVVAASARAEFGAEVKRYAGRRGWHQLLISGNGNRWHPAGVNLWLRELGVFGQRSHEKRVPEAAFRLGNAQIALLLRHLWATDGCIYAPPAGQHSGGRIYYSTNSRALAGDVMALLLRLGIVARLYTTPQGRYRPAYAVHVSGAENQKLFLGSVGAFGPRAAQAERLTAWRSGCAANTNVDTLPQECFEDVKGLMRARGISPRQMAAARGTAYGGTSHFSFAPSRAHIREYADLLGAADLAARTTDDLFWDRVVSVEPAGEEEVYDLTVPGPESWLADGICSHNSGAIEQDADVVSFIFREEYYNQTEENMNKAEIILAKQRNGPTGTVELAFLKEITRFENVYRG